MRVKQKVKWVFAYLFILKEEIRHFFKVMI